MSVSKDAKKKDSNVYMGIAGFATFCYSLWNYVDTTKNPSENKELDQVNKNIAIAGSAIGIMGIIAAFLSEEKERKELEELERLNIELERLKKE